MNKTKFVIEKKGNMNVPIKLFISKSLVPNKITIDHLKDMASLSGVERAIVALPDIHYKYGSRVPTGTVFATNNLIYPKIANADCGMAMIKTSLKESDLDDKVFEDLFKKIMERVSVKMRTKPIISDKELINIIKEGHLWAFDKYKLEKKDIHKFDYTKKIVLKKDLLKIIPRESFKFGPYCLGVLGTGNHFIEMQAIDEIRDKNKAELLGLKKRQIVFMLHTNSREFGDVIHDYYSGEKQKIPFIRKSMFNIYNKVKKNKGLKKTVDTLNKYKKQAKQVFYLKFANLNRPIKKYSSIKADSALGRDFILAKEIAMNFAKVNRLTIIDMIKKSLDEFFTKPKTSLIIDSNHDSIYEEEFEGKKLMVHRNGAVRAFPPEKCKKHRTFRKTGYPLMVPGSMGAFSYLCATTKGCKETFYSANHGAGRLLDKPEARKKFKLKEILSEMESRKIRLYRYKTGNIVEECPASYKNIDEIIKIMQNNKIAEPVAKLRPLAVLKGN